MSEQDWADEPAVPPKKKGLPGWVLFCGAGCLILMVLGAIGAYFAVQEVKQMVDPEAQWARLDESLPMDERPPELNMMFGMGIGIDMWMISDQRGYIAAIYDFGESEAEGRDEIFSEDFTGGGVPGMNQIEDPVLGEVVVQGRTLQLVRLRNKGGFNPGGGEGVSGDSAACFIDLTEEGDPGFMMLFFMRNPAADKELALEPISDEAIQEFLLPFTIGPDREVYMAPEGTGVDPGLKGMIDEAEKVDRLEAPDEEE